MQPHVVIQGTLQADGTLALDQKPELPPGRVQVIVMPATDLSPNDSFWQRTQSLWDGQRARGHEPRGAAEVAAERRVVTCDEWEQRMRYIEHLQAEAEPMRSKS